MKINKPNKKKIIIIITSIFVLITCLAAIYLFCQSKNTDKTSTDAGHGYYNPNTNDPSTKVPTTDTKKDQTTGSINSSSPNTGAALAPSPNASVTPSAPVGSFVSNHRPNLSGQPTPNTETSACTTTPGTKCKITFTMGNTVKSLAEQITDINGNTSWNWKLQDIGLTVGTWTIAAIATNGDHTSSSVDATPLQVN